ncbi:hypothetical protein Ancab_035661, partial [Ancistrocladus abbreviatus]
ILDMELRLGEFSSLVLVLLAPVVFSYLVLLRVRLRDEICIGCFSASFRVVVVRGADGVVSFWFSVGWGFQRCGIAPGVVLLLVSDLYLFGSVVLILRLA